MQQLTSKSPETIVYMTAAALLRQVAFLEAVVTLDYIDDKITRVTREILGHTCTARQARRETDTQQYIAAI